MKTKTLVALGTLSMLGVQIPGYATPPPPVPNVNLVYVPVEPCRVADTRISTGGNLVANTPQSFLTYGDAGDLTNQGGNTAGCPHPKETAGQKPKAALLNITGVGRQVATGTAGNIIAYPADGTAPNLSLVNITGGANVANAATIVLSTTDGQSVALKSSINVPAIVDILGYYYPQCQ